MDEGPGDWCVADVGSMCPCFFFYFGGGVDLA